MIKFKKINTYTEFSIFFWIILISIIAISVSSIYTKIKIEQGKKIEESLDNIYLKKTLKEINKKLEPRFTDITYSSKSGDTHQSIIDNLKIPEIEKKNT